MGPQGHSEGSRRKAYVALSLVEKVGGEEAAAAVVVVHSVEEAWALEGFLLVAYPWADRFRAVACQCEAGDLEVDLEADLVVAPEAAAAVVVAAAAVVVVGVAAVAAVAVAAVVEGHRRFAVMEEDRDQVHLAACLKVVHTTGGMAETFQAEEADVAEIHRMEMLYPAVSNIPLHIWENKAA